MKPLTIEIHGTGTNNRGAELMTIAIAERIRCAFPGVRLVVAPTFGDFEARARYGFWTTWEFSGRVRTRVLSELAKRTSARVEKAALSIEQYTQPFRFLSPRMRMTIGVLNPRDIDVVLDASGFACSDQWGPDAVRRRVQKMSGAARANQPLVLLPQAFGPFRNPEVASWTRRLVERASLVCARDSASHRALISLGTPRATLRRFPDFTVGVRARLPNNLNLPRVFSAVVPNMRMVDKGESGPAYLDFLTRAIGLLQDRGMGPAFVLHDAREDQTIVDQIRQRGAGIPVFEHTDPRVLKAILGRATVVVGSRFHALVSALSQGVPCIGAGWSHKYAELFGDFDCPEFLVSDLASTNQFDEAMHLVTSASGREQYQRRLRIAAARIEQQNKEMWSQVEELISAFGGASPPSRRE